MMTLRKIADYITAQPFRPFRVNMASGSTFDVRYPEDITVGRTKAQIFIPHEESNADDRWHDVSLLLIESIELIDVSVGQEGS